MTLTDLIGFSGVFLLLLAFFLNIFGMMKRDGVAYIVMNILGAGIAAVASVMLHYVPFIILEATWTGVSLFALIRWIRQH